MANLNGLDPAVFQMPDFKTVRTSLYRARKQGQTKRSVKDETDKAVAAICDGLEGNPVGIEGTDVTSGYANPVPAGESSDAGFSGDSHRREGTFPDDGISTPSDDVLSGSGTMTGGAIAIVTKVQAIKQETQDAVSAICAELDELSESDTGEQSTATANFIFTPNTEVHAEPATQAATGPRYGSPFGAQTYVNVCKYASETSVYENTQARPYQRYAAIRGFTGATPSSDPQPEFRPSKSAYGRTPNVELEPNGSFRCPYPGETGYGVFSTKSNRSPYGLSPYSSPFGQNYPAPNVSLVPPTSVPHYPPVPNPKTVFPEPDFSGVLKTPTEKVKGPVPAHSVTRRAKVFRAVAAFRFGHSVNTDLSGYADVSLD